MKQFLLGSLGFLSIATVGSAQGQTVSKQHPNVIYVFPDQLRNAAMGFWSDKDFSQYVNFKGDPTHTPRLNQFAHESVVLSSAQSNNPVSSPYRGSLFTGMYSHKSGVPLNCRSDHPFSNLPDSATCISDVFAEAGYECAYIGKLHLIWPTPNDPQNPGHYKDPRTPAWDAYTEPHQRHHFSYWYSYGTWDVHKDPHYWDADGNLHEPHEYSPKHEVDKAIEYLKNKDGKLHDASKPFFMVVSMNPPHSPYRTLNDCMEEDYNLYKDIPLDSLLVRPNVDFKMDKTKSAPYYFANVTGVDREFGRLLDALKELKLDKNTIVVFTSDHGETMCSQGATDPKNLPYSEAMNVPFLIRYPKHLTPRVDDLMISSPDIYPTLLGLTGLGTMIPSHVQGRNLAPLFLNPKSKKVARPQSALYFQHVDGPKDANGIEHEYIASSRGIKTSHYTLALFIDKNTYQLKSSNFYDDQNDPYQLHNIPLSERPDVVKDLCKQMAVQLKAIDDIWYEKRILSDMIPY